MTDNELKIIVSAKDLASGVLKSVSGQVKKMSGNISAYLGKATEASKGLAVAISGIAVGAGYGIATYGSEVQNLNNKLISVTGSQESANEMFKELSAVAINSRSDLNGVISSFQKFESTNKALGKPTKDTIKLVETLAKGLQVSGASAEEASSAQLQLAQAYASGVLQGDEFKSLAESFPLLMRSMEKTLGVTTTELKKMGSAGELTRIEIENAMSYMATNVETLLASMPVTIGQAFSIGRTIAIDALNDINQSTHIFDKIGSIILGLGLKFKEVVPSIIAFINSINMEHLQLFAVVVLSMITPAIISMTMAIGSAMIAIAPFILAGVLIYENWEPIKEFLLGLGIDFDDLGATMGRLKDFMLEAWELIKIKIQTVITFFNSDILPILQGFFAVAQETLTFFVESWNYTWDLLKETFFILWEAIKTIIAVAWEIIQNIILFGLNILQGNWSSAWNNMKAILFAIWTGFQAIIQAGIDIMLSLISAGLKAISDVWNGVWSGIGGVVTSSFNSVMDTVSSAVDWIVSKINSLLSALDSAKNAVSNIGSSVSSTASSAWDSASSAISSINPFATGGVGNYGFGAGVTSGLRVGIAGESGPEAIVPLPDGRSIPVVMKGASGGGSAVVNNVNINIEGTVTSERNLIDAVSEGFANAIGRDFNIHL